MWQTKQICLFAVDVFMCYCWETRIGKLLTDYFALWASLLIRTSKPVESVYLRTRIKNV